MRTTVAVVRNEVSVRISMRIRSIAVLVKAIIRHIFSKWVHSWVSVIAIIRLKVFIAIDVRVEGGFDRPAFLDASLFVQTSLDSTRNLERITICSNGRFENWFASNRT